jgi:MFS family permease
MTAVPVPARNRPSLNVTISENAGDGERLRRPILAVLKEHPKEVILSALVRLAEQAPFYVFTAFIFPYGTGTLQVFFNFLLTAVLAASVLSFVAIPFFGHLSDGIGRKKMYMIGAAATGVLGFIYFGLLGTGSAALIFLAIFFSLIPHDHAEITRADVICTGLAPQSSAT